MPRTRVRPETCVSNKLAGAAIIRTRAGEARWTVTRADGISWRLGRTKGPRGRALQARSAEVNFPQDF